MLILVFTNLFQSIKKGKKMFSINFSAIQQKTQHLSLGTLCKSIAISGLVLFVFYTFLYNQPNNQNSNFFVPFKLNWPTIQENVTNIPTNISHIVFGVIGSMNTWKHKKPYTESWWQPNVTRGYLFLDRAPTDEFQPWPSSSPPFRVNEDIRNWTVYPRIRSPIQIRMARSSLELFRQGDKNVRWYVMADDDTVLFIDNLVEVLSKYDHNKYYYIGANSECITSNSAFSFDMAFGGAGYALSYPLVENLATKLDGCIERYPYMYVSDFLLHTCLADFGVDLTKQKGFHQIDLLSDLSGFLSAHPQSPVLSLHHIDTIDPIFPSKNRSESINHLMKAAKADHSRVLQQTICYLRQTNWSFSVSWGYSAHIYENIYPRSHLRRPLETFRPWGRGRPPFFMFNTRWGFNNPCDAPHAFFFDSIENLAMENQIVTTYVRASPRGMPPCSWGGNHSAEPVSRVRVFSSATEPKEVGKIECCDVEYMADTNITNVRYRACRKDEVLA